MILPIGDSPNPSGTPLVTYLLIAANVAVYVLTLPMGWSPPDLSDPLLVEYAHLVARQTGYKVSIQEILAQVSAYDLLIYRWGYRPAAPGLTNLFTSMFLHGGFAHLAGNMLFLWIYGDNVEHRLGHVRYLGYYLLAGVAATLFHAMFSPASGLPLVGASGAISGVLGFYFIWFPRNQVHLLLLFPFLLRMTISARTLLGIYIFIENILPFLISRGSGGVAHGAHIGGFVAGLIVARWFDKSEETHQYAAIAPSSDVDLEDALANGRWADAAKIYFDPGTKEAPLPAHDSIHLGNWLLANQQPRAALTIFRRHLRDYPNGPGSADAHLGAGLVQLRHFDQETAAFQHFLEALDHRPSADVERAVRAALEEISSHQRPLRRPRLAG